eukprot:COSAG01_NODE_51044_length_358_cov_0.745174_2_plen_49_part_01
MLALEPQNIPIWSIVTFQTHSLSNHSDLAPSQTTATFNALHTAYRTTLS